MASFGERLRRTRENKKMSLDDVARSTKINIRMLTALEQEKFDQLPGGVFNKGFVRAYARHLGLDEQQALRDFASASRSIIVETKSEDAELRAIAERKEKERAGRPQSKGVPWGIVAAFLLILAFGLSIWGFFTRERVGRDAVRSASPLRSGVDSPPPSDDASASSSAEAAPTDVTTTQNGSDVADDSSTATPTQPVGSAPIVLEVSAHEDSWLSITADGQSIYHNTLSAGRKHNISARDQVVLKAGNIGGLDITFNGNKLPPQGSDAEVKTLTFVPSGFQQTPQ